MSSPCVVISPAFHPFDNHTLVNSTTSESSTSKMPPPVSNNLNSGNVNNVSSDLCPSANEIMKGPVTLLSSNHGPQRVIMSVFRTSVDHFALVYPDNRRKMIASKPVGCMNIRGVTCEETSLGAQVKGFTLRPKKCDTSSAALIFVCQDASTLPQWLSAFKPSSTTILGTRKMPRQCSLPSVEEEE